MQPAASIAARRGCDEPRRARDELGVTVIEYALIGTLVAIAIIGGALALGQSLGSSYDEISTQLDAVTP